MSEKIAKYQRNSRELRKSNISKNSSAILEMPGFLSIAWAMQENN